MKKTIITILSLLFLSTSVNALDFEIINKDKKEEINQFNLFKKSDKVPYFTIDNNSRLEFQKINNTLLKGDIKTAKKLATKFYNRTNVMSFNNEIVKYLSTIALGNTYLKMGEEIKWKYMQLPLLDEILKKKEQKLGINYMFLILELGDIIIKTKDKDRAFIIINGAFKQLKQKKLNLDREIYLESNYKFNKLIFQIYGKNAKFKKMEKAWKQSEINIKSKYTYYSLQEANILFLKAKIYIDIAGDIEKAFDPLKNAFLISEQILKKENLDKESILLADIYYYLGLVYSSGTKQKEAIEYFKKAELIYIKSNLKGMQLNCKTKISISFKLLKKYTSALEVNKAQKKLALETYGEISEEYATALIVESDIYNTMEEKEKAIKLILKAKNIYSKKYGKYSKEVKIINSSLNYIQLQEEEF